MANSMVNNTTLNTTIYSTNYSSKVNNGQKKQVNTNRDGKKKEQACKNKVINSYKNKSNIISLPTQKNEKNQK